jgi:hypothetical protein
VVVAGVGALSLWLVRGSEETAPRFALGSGADGPFVERSTARRRLATPIRSSEWVTVAGCGAVTAGVAGAAAGAGAGVTEVELGGAVTAGVVAAGGVSVGADVVSVGVLVAGVGAGGVSVGGAGAGVVSVGYVVLAGSGGAVVPSVGVVVAGLESVGPASAGGSPHDGSEHASTGGALGPQVGSSGSHWAGGGGSMSSASLVRITDRIRPLAPLARITGCECDATAAPADAVGIRVAAVTRAATPAGARAGEFVGSPRRRGRHRGQSRR